MLAFLAGILTSTFTGEKLNVLYKDTLGLLVSIPSYLRPVYGTVSDLVPLFGYHRRSYLALAALLMAGGFFALSRLPRHTYGVTTGLVMVELTGVILMMVIADAVMVRIGNATDLIGRLQTIQQFMSPALVLPRLLPRREPARRGSRGRSTGWSCPPSAWAGR